MNIFGSYLKSKRKLAGLTQESLATKLSVTKNTVQNWESGKAMPKLEVIKLLAKHLNIPEADILAEIIRALPEEPNNWPDFLFDKETNEIVSSLHLNLKEQDLFGLLYIYDSEYLSEDNFTTSTFKDDLKKIPFEFINSVGSIQFMIISEKLQQVLKYIKTDFLLKILKLNPEKEFDLCRLTKEQICDFIDNGYKTYDRDFTDWDDQAILDEIALNININITETHKVLKELVNDKVLVSVYNPSDKKCTLTEEFHNRLPFLCPCNNRTLHDKLFDKENSDIHKRCDSRFLNLQCGDTVKESTEKDDEGRIYLYYDITETGRKLLEWFNGKENAK